MLKISLVVPNYRWSQGDEHTYWVYPPYGLCCLAATIESRYEVEIIDAYFQDLSEDELEQAVKASSPDVVGITVIMDQFADSGHKTAAVVNRIDNNIKILFGGVYATLNPHQAIKDDNIDYVIIGEGESVLSKLLGYIEGENPLPEKGVCFRKDGRIIDLGMADAVDDMDSLPMPAYHLIPFEAYCNIVPRRGTIGAPPLYPYVRLLTSRGCPYGCAFCQIEHISGRRFRPKSADNVLKEIQWLKENYGIKSLVFADDNFFLDRKRVVNILNGMIERGLDMPWIAEDAAVFKLDKELLKLMKKSGCHYVGIAVETGTERVLKQIIKGKPVDFDHTISIVKESKRLGIYIAANFILGFPTETWDEIRQTLKFAEKIDADYVRFFAAIPLKKTRLWDLCEKENAFISGYDHFNTRSSWSSGLIETDEFSHNDLTILRAYEWDRINFTDYEKMKRTADMIKVSVEELREIRRNTLKNALQKLSGLVCEEKR